LKSKTHQFTINGKYLIENGMHQGELIGKVLKEIEKKWIKNNFKVSKNEIKEIIKIYSD
jgi:tRNA nucleotidyltransferase/poly(A) polymerase